MLQLYRDKERWLSAEAGWLVQCSAFMQMICKAIFTDTAAAWQSQGIFYIKQEFYD